MKFFTKTALSVLLASAATSSAGAIGWPANYEGVMLQGFYWDSYTDTKWTNLESKADEYSKYFKLIWIPNSGRCAPDGNKNMGYMPQYWFTNHNSSFGTETQLRHMINTYKEKGVGFIADVVINHRNGVTNWADFPTEQWNGQTWHIGPEGICCNDELANASGQVKPTGAYDTGDNFDGCRDLDHTNANVQNNCKNYCKFLLEDLGYAGFRYDMVKGYGGQYNKIYNQYSRPTYSVGEYWDASYDAVAGWIDATGKESAAFDFPCKYAINSAFSKNDMTQLVWKANGVTDQPAGMIHFGYSQLAVTFVDNHDTYRDGSKFTDDAHVPAANAFILMSPGTPCVFLPHYQQHKAAIQALINIRNAAGIHNNSVVNVLKSTSNCYMAEVTGSKGKAVVKIGSAWDSPSGYSDSDIKASGQDYCVWFKGNVQGGGDEVEMPEKMYVLGNLESGHWQTHQGVEMTKSGTSFVARNVKLVLADNETHSFFTFVTALSSNPGDWDAVNNGGDRYGAPSKDTPINLEEPSAMQRYKVNVDASAAQSWKIPAGTYDLAADFKNMKVTAYHAGTLSAVEVEYADPASSVTPIYYNLQGVRVSDPTPGLYIVVRGSRVTKEYLR